MKRAKDIDFTIDDRFVYSAAQLVNFTQYRIVTITLFEDQNKGEINQLKARGNQ